MTHSLALILLPNEIQQVVQQRAAQMEVEDARRQVQELTASKKQLQGEVNTLKERLDAEILAKNDELCEPLSQKHSPILTTDCIIAVKRSIQARLQELEITSSATATIHSGGSIVNARVT